MSGAGTGTPASTTAALCTLAQVKARGGNATTQQDTLISALIPIVLARFNAECDREFMPQVTEARTFRVDDDMVYLHHYDLRSATLVQMHPESVSEATTLTSGTDYTIVLDRNTSSTGILQLAKSLSLSSTHRTYFGYSQVAITGGWGVWASVSNVPDDINAAAIETVLSWINKPASVATGYDVYSPPNGLPANPPSWDIPRSAWLKLQPYKRHAWVA